MSKLSPKQQEALVHLFEEVATALGIDLEEYVKEAERAEHDEILEEIINRTQHSEPVTLVNGYEAYIDRINVIPDHRGIQFFGVVVLENEDGQPYFKQIAWDSNFKHSNGKTGISNFDIDLELLLGAKKQWNF